MDDRFRADPRRSIGLHFRRERCERESDFEISFVIQNHNVSAFEQTRCRILGRRNLNDWLIDESDFARKNLNGSSCSWITELTSIRSPSVERIGGEDGSMGTGSSCAENDLLLERSDNSTRI